MDVSINYFTELDDGNGETLESRLSQIASVNEWPVVLRDATNTIVIAVCEDEEQLRSELTNRGVL